MVGKFTIETCALKGCNRLAAIDLKIRDKVLTQEAGESFVCESFCCKTHMLRYLQKVKMPRYSKKRIQRIVGTAELALGKTRKK